MPQALSTPPVVAAVDLGSNSFHMKVARVERGRIHVIDRGRIVESGSHEELVAHDGTYAALWRVQTGEWEGALE